MRNSTLTFVLLFLIALFVSGCSEESPTAYILEDAQTDLTSLSLNGNLYDECGEVVLWNTLGSPTEVTNSEIGPNMVIGGSPTFEPGPFGNAVTIDHYSQYLTVNLWEPGAKYWGQDEFTFEFWCRINAYGWLGFIFDFLKGREDQYGYLRLYMDHSNSGKLHFNSACDFDLYEPGADLFTLPNGYDFGAWHHYAVVVSTTDTELYYDGQLLVSRPLRDRVLNTKMPYQLDVGGEFQHNHTDFHFYGSEDNWKVYDYVKTDFSDRFNEAPFIDTDCDGVPDTEDPCPESIVEETIIIDNCDTGVGNYMLESGCTLSDLIAESALDAMNHGDFVSAVAQLTNTWKKDGLISGKEKGAIQRCAAHSNIP